VPISPAGEIGGEVEALNLTTGEVQWDTKVQSLPSVDELGTAWYLA
jgi:hypothetical protein